MLVFLWNAGVVGYHGCSVMFHLGRPLALHPATRASFEAALFGSGEYTLVEPARTGDVDFLWSDPETFRRERPSEPAEPWTWHAADRVVEGIAWGGNLEVLSWLAMADREIGPPESYAGCVLLLETSESMPSDEEVYWILQSFGERGLLGQFPAVLVGRARAWTTRRRLDHDAKLAYRRGQHDAVRRAFERYSQNPLIVFDVDFGHTEPQFIIPTGGRVRVDGIARAITVTY